MARRRERLKKPGSRYVTSLDGLRAICALGVIGYHMRLNWCGGGLLGVTVLFVLSGYLVTSGLLHEFSSTRGTIDLVSFWKRRVARIMPTAVVFVAVTGAICALCDAALFTKMRGDIIPALLMVINWTKILSNESYFAAAGNPSPLTHFWSLAIEAQFYLIWPPILYLLMRKRVARKKVRVGVLVAAAISAALMALLYVPGADPSRPYYGTDTRAMSLLLGCWLAIIWPMNRMSTRRASRMDGFAGLIPIIIGPLCVLGIILMMLFTEGYTSFYYYAGFLLCSILSVGAIAGLVPAGSLFAKALSFKPLAWLGSRSFAIYVWHYPILELMNPLNATTDPPWWKLLLELVIILVISELSYRFVEVPLRKLGSPAKEDARKAENKRGRRGRARRERQSRFVPFLPARFDVVLPAAVITLLGTAVTLYGLVFVEPVTVAGDRPEERRVMQASLKKPLQDGVYDVVFIGDSVSLGANEQLNEAFPHGLIDTMGERQASAALASLQDYLDQGIVGDQVVISIGTNGVLTDEDMQGFIDAVGDRDLWYINLRSPNAKDIDNNALIDEYVAKYDNMHLIDWNSATEGHEDWLIEDGIHLTWDGRDAFAKLVVDTMDYEVPNDTNTVYSVTIMGDTVCLQAANELAKAFPKGIVDTADGRSPQEVTKAYQAYDKQEVVGDAVVLSIGNEEQLEANDLTDFVNAVGNDKKLWIINVRGGSWQKPNNEMIKNAASSHDNVQVIDWLSASQDHDDWFEDDGIHLNQEGISAYVSLVKEKVKVAEDRSSKDDEESGEEDGGEYDEESYDEYGSESNDSDEYSSDESDSEEDADTSSSKSSDSDFSSDSGSSSDSDSDSDSGSDTDFDSDSDSTSSSESSDASSKKDSSSD
ncbi:MAG: acyltransferase [Atopobiaceae bacterium]|nr:acyltransferase [Atopobiaceae bacterium]